MKFKYWTLEEIDFLKVNYQHMTIPEIHELMPERTRKSIEWKVSDIGLKKEKKKIPIPIVDFAEKLCPIKVLTKLVKNPYPPFKKWKPIISKELFYILGVIMGDGSVTMIKQRRGYMYVISLGAIDKPFVDEVSDTLEKIGLHPYKHIEERKLPRKRLYRVRAQSKAFFIWFKTIDYRWILDADMGYIYSFLKGMYESDGSLDIGKKGIKVRIRNVNATLLLTIKKMLERLKYHPTFFTMKKDCLKSGRLYYAVNLNRKNEVKNFLKEINPCIARRAL